MATVEPPLPYGRHRIDREDVDAVVEVLTSDWLTTGPMIGRFEQTLAENVGARHGIALANGTAALHAAMFALGIGPGNEVIVPPLTFVATANAVLYLGATPVFADVIEKTLLLDPAQVEARITNRTRAIIAVDYAGQPCDYKQLRDLADHHGLFLVADACHSLGAEYRSRRVGSLADLTVFSFHPLKPITSGEGGMVTTDNSEFAERIRCFRNHGISTDHHQRRDQSTWRYQMEALGFNYRLSDLHSALGLSQLKKLQDWTLQRRMIAAEYDLQLKRLTQVVPLAQAEDRSGGWHLYVVRVDSRHREALFQQLRQAGIGVNVHYLPVYRHPYYQQRFGSLNGQCPVAETAYEQILSLPIFPGLKKGDVERVCAEIESYFLAKG